MHYYNENNPQAAAMLRQMIADGLMPAGDVDKRSITEVQPDDLEKYTQCHFFAGIGGWQYALQLAGWPADKPVWTGSCPCQPFSTAGRQTGKADERHLWPEWLRLIKECRPPAIFGEQVASAVTHGWLDDVYEGLEAEGYAVGAAVLPACSVGAPHRRDRLWFVGYAEHHGRLTSTEQRSNGAAVHHNTQREDSPSQFEGAGCSNTMANAENQRSDVRGCGQHCGKGQTQRAAGGGSSICDVADTKQPRLEGHGRPKQGDGAEGWQDTERHPWQSGVWVACPDGKQRLVEPSVPLLAHGLQHRKPILHAFGNAILPQVAAEFIMAT